jgi:hypothetical protein
MKLKRKSSTDVQLYPPKFPHEWAWVRCRNTADRGRRLIAWVMALSNTGGGGAENVTDFATPPHE